MRGFSLINLCLIEEKAEDLFPSWPLLKGRTWRGSFSGGVSVPKMSGIFLVRGTAFWFGSLSLLLPELWSSDEGLLRKESIDFCRCISDCWKEVGEGKRGKKRGELAPKDFWAFGNWSKILQGGRLKMRNYYLGYCESLVAYSPLDLINI